MYGDGQDAKKHPRNFDKVVGSGPFKLVEFVRDQHIILERYDGYFIKDRPYVDKIVMRIIKDPAARALGRKNGEILLSTFESTPQDINHSKKISLSCRNRSGLCCNWPYHVVSFQHQEQAHQR